MLWEPESRRRRRRRRPAPATRACRLNDKIRKVLFFIVACFGRPNLAAAQFLDNVALLSAPLFGGPSFPSQQGLRASTPRLSDLSPTSSSQAGGGGPNAPPSPPAFGLWDLNAGPGAASGAVPGAGPGPVTGANRWPFGAGTWNQAGFSGQSDLGSESGNGSELFEASRTIVPKEFYDAESMRRISHEQSNPLSQWSASVKSSNSNAGSQTGSGSTPTSGPSLSGQSVKNADTATLPSSPSSLPFTSSTTRTGGGGADSRIFESPLYKTPSLAAVTESRLENFASLMSRASNTAAQQMVGVANAANNFNHKVLDGAVDVLARGTETRNQAAKAELAILGSVIDANIRWLSLVNDINQRVARNVLTAVKSANQEPPAIQPVREFFSAAFGEA